MAKREKIKEANQSPNEIPFLIKMVASERGKKVLCVKMWRN
jgi:hypothetical protein